VETWFKLRTIYSDIMVNYHFSQKFKLLGNCEFNHLTIILIYMMMVLKIGSCLGVFSRSFKR
jgi:hypothetical protein